jgi:hypothetical protein
MDDPRRQRTSHTGRNDQRRGQDRGRDLDLSAGLRRWASGVLPVEAATELLLRAFGGRFTKVGYPWVRGSVEDGLWIDWDQMTGANLQPYSGGEQRLLRIAASLGGGLEVDLAEAATGLDPARIDLVLASVAHAAGMRQLHPWPSTS